MPLRWRGPALLPAAALAVHQLRFKLAYGGEAGHELARQGHGYLGILAPAIALLTAACLGLFLSHLLGAWQGGQRGGRTGRPFLFVWATIAGLLVALYAGQELLEGMIATGHPAGLTGVFGSGGVLAIPLSVAVAALVAILLRSAEAAISWAAAHGPGTVAPPRRASGSAVTLPHPVVFPVLPPLATSAAGRAPPGSPQRS